MGERRELPILFTGEMVRAILDGRKTVTRRVVNPQPEDVLVPEEGFVDCSPDGYVYGRDRYLFGDDPDNPQTGVEDMCFPSRCPYGAPGDLLYVKETWAKVCDCYVDQECRGRDCEHCRIVYRATEPEAKDRYCASWEDDGPMRWRPSIFMPKRVSRIWLRVTDVRVDRVQEITTEDIIAEGLSTTLREHEAVCALRDQWVTLWDRINAKRGYPWADNPWVWVVSFERVEP